MKRFLLVIFSLLVLTFSLNAQTPETMSFQGLATDNAGNMLPDGSYSFDFRIYDVPVAGGSIWHEVQNVPVMDGIFNVILGDVTPLGMTFAQQYWLGVEIDGNGEMTPRIQLASSPYALSARTVEDGAIDVNKLDPAFLNAGGDLDGNYPNPSVTGIQNRDVSALAPANGEVLKWDGSNWEPAPDNAGGGSIWNSSGPDIYYDAGNVGIGTNSPVSDLEVNGTTTTNTLDAPYYTSEQDMEFTIDKNDNGGLFAAFEIFNGAGQHAFAVSENGDTRTFGNFAVDGWAGIHIYDPQALLHSFNENNPGVLGPDMGSRYYTTQTLAPAVYGQSLNNTANTSFGLYGNAFSTSSWFCMGVFGEGGDGTVNNYGVYGVGYGASGSNYSIAVYGEDFGAATIGNYAGFFAGDVEVSGTLSKSAGTFKIDHPLDPSNKYLIHSFVESPDMMNVYNGNITTDNTGTAVVDLPSYFETLNIDYRYQLTVIGSFSQAIIDQEVQNNKFVIKTDKPNIKVSWQVTGVRNDEYARAHRVVPEVFKEGVEKGKYIHPELFGKSANEGLPVGAK